MNIAIIGANVQQKNQQCFIGRPELVKTITNSGHKLTVIGSPPYKICNSNIESLGANYKQVLFDQSKLSFTRDLVKTFKPLNLDAVIVYSIKHIPSAVTAAKLAGIDKIFAVINGSGRLFQLKGLKGNVIKGISLVILKYMLKSCDITFFQNPDDMQMFINMKLVSKSKANKVNGSGVNLTKFTPVNMPKEIVFLMVSRLLKEKGVIEYINAARILKRQFPEARFQLIGPLDKSSAGVSYKDLNNFIDDGTIEYIGEVSNVQKYYGKSSVFVLPSYYREGIPRVILEAMATGRPIITTDSPGCRETVVDGRNGFIIPARDTELLAEKMKWFINHFDEALEMGQQSRIICEEKFDVNIVNKNMLNKMNLK